ncbi:MAG: hypothetical protein KJZ78_20825, partial [Bryobacteraceae bacterium]|nr:hypothetical protein [Bryobacteraceae bacterium]
LVRRSGQTVCESGETRNLSSGGVLFTSNVPVRVGDAIEYLITLPHTAAGSIRLRCLGKVIRLEDDMTVAATLERYEFMRH